MTLIALKDGHEVARVHGPHRNEYVLEYHDPGTGHAVRMSRPNVHVLRGIAERVFPGLTWQESHGTPASSGEGPGEPG
jgi:hypothetical protein